MSLIICWGVVAAPAESAACAESAAGSVFCASSFCDVVSVGDSGSPVDSPSDASASLFLLPSFNICIAAPAASAGPASAAPAGPSSFAASASPCDCDCDCSSVCWFCAVFRDSSIASLRVF